MLVFDKEVYRDKAYGGWLGKNIGGTLGAPHEGTKELLSLTFYPKLPEGKPLPNDDLDLQLVWLHALEQYGPRLTAVQLARAWVDHVRFPFDEYGYALYNLRRGMLPPLSGWFGNPFSDCMGAPIRSEIWAMIAPGLPELAAYYAWHDAIVDHGGGEGVWGEVFFAAIESAAFVESDPHKVIDVGLRFIPESCRVAQAVRTLLALHGAQTPWQRARELILQEHGHSNFTDAPQNIAFTLLGWLYGEDFEDALLKAVNCGYDTDCTAATLGAILGIIHGAKGIPDKWSAPVGDAVVLSPAIVGIDPPRTLDELTERTLAVANETLAAWRVPLRIGESGRRLILDELPATPTPYERAVGWSPSAVSPSLLSGAGVANGLEIIVDYGGDGPAIGRAERRNLSVRLRNTAAHPWEGIARLTVPEGWSGPEPIRCALQPGAELDWQPAITSPADPSPEWTLTLELQRFLAGKSFWHKEVLPLAMVPKLEWELTGPSGFTARTASPTMAVPFSARDVAERPGPWRARTLIISAADREANLIVATPAPLRVTLSGEKILEAREPRTFMPAYHRPVQGTWRRVLLGRGANPLEIEVFFAEQVEPVMVALTDPTPGLQHAVLDVMFCVEVE